MKRIPKAVLLLIISLIGNVILSQVAWDNHLDANGLRLNPLGLSFYPTDAVQPVEKDAGQRLVVFYGDSRAEQWRFPKQPEITADFVFVDRGIGNQTSSQVVGRFDEHIRPLQPDVIVLQVCINDLKQMPLFPDSQKTIIENCKANIQKIVAKSQEIGATLVLSTIFPYGDLPPARLFNWPPEVLLAIQDINQFIQSLAEEEGVFVLDAYSLLADEAGVMREEYKFEFLHLNGEGYAVLNEALAEILNLVE